MKFMVSSQEKSENSPLYSVHTYLDSFILCNNESFGELDLVGEQSPNITENMEGENREGEALKQFAESEKLQQTKKRV